MPALIHKVFVDGNEGTTGLEIGQRLAGRKDIEVLDIVPARKKDPDLKKEILNQADLVFLCLPDAAARESVSLIKNPSTRIIDASTAHRIHPEWTYGLPELGQGQREQIRKSTRVANPGCHATGLILGLAPLLAGKIMDNDHPVTCMSITGYSGGGKSLIGKYQSDITTFPGKDAPMGYALTLSHKHLPEMKEITGLLHPPLFLPVVSNYYRGMAVYLPLHLQTLRAAVCARDIHAIISEYYAGETFVRVIPFENNPTLETGFLDPQGCNETNRVDIFVFGHTTQAMVVIRLDNLGKGASGAAVQNMNLMLGCPEATGLTF